jgi:uncharacterized protein YjbI with pentapeptide repeats
MSNDLVNLTLPMTQQGLNVVLTTVGVAVLCGAVYLMLASMDQKGRARGQRWLEVLGWVFAPVWLLLFVGTMWQVWLILNLRDSALGQSGLGAGALIAALLGAPFVIWGTWLRHKTQRIEQEGHMTDRINKAVEQLGVEKTVERIGRSVTLSLGNPEEINFGEQLETKTVIEWQGTPVRADQGWWITEPGEWKVFSETVPNLEVRIGAILSLERIAQDSTILDRGRDHVRVMEILCVYIRENSNARKPVDFPFPNWEPLKDDPTDEERTAHLAWREARFKGDGRTLAEQWVRTLPKPRTDVQQALYVIGRRNAEQRKVEAAWPDPPNAETRWPFDTACPRLPDKPVEQALSETELENFKQGLEAWKATLQAYRGYRLDLRGANLQASDMSAKQADGSGAVFSGVIFNKARMEGAMLVHARADGAFLWGARLEGASLYQTQLAGANFWEACLEGAFLLEAMMEGANLMHVRMEGANLGQARLGGADLLKAVMERAELNRVRLEGALLNQARLDGANLNSARIEGANFEKANLSGASMRFLTIDPETCFAEVVFNDAAFQEVDFSILSFPNLLSIQQVTSAFADLSVTLSDCTQRPAHWPDVFLEDLHFSIQWRKWQANPDTYTPPDNPTP